MEAQNNSQQAQNNIQKKPINFARSVQPSVEEEEESVVSPRLLVSEPSLPC